MILGIDPGPHQTAFAIWSIKIKRLANFAILPNDDFIRWIRIQSAMGSIPVVEMIQSFGMPVGKEIFETILLIGRIIEIYDCQNIKTNLVYRKDIKLHFCGSNKAKDSNIRQALIDRFGPPGIKKNPGILYGVKKDIWSALACAIYWEDINNSTRKEVKKNGN